ncbi:multicilin [Salminus brasiliensis]|uniref:multicilin n=1 Tax=Salminus brasiliensis TaxID=930266 RepID=UPI003B82EF6B
MEESLCTDSSEILTLEAGEPTRDHLDNTLDLNRQLRASLQRKQEEISALKEKNTQLKELAKQTEHYAAIMDALIPQPVSHPASGHTPLTHCCSAELSEWHFTASEDSWLPSASINTPQACSHTRGDILTKTPTQEGLTKTPTQEGLTKTPTQEGLTKTPTQDVLTKPPIQGSLTKTLSQDVLTMTPTQSVLTKTLSQDSLTKTPTQEDLTKTPTQEGLIKTLSQDGLTKTPTQEDLTKTPTQEGLIKTLSQDVLTKTPSQDGLTKTLSQDSLTKTPTQEGQSDQDPFSGQSDQDPYSRRSDPDSRFMNSVNSFLEESAGTISPDPKRLKLDLERLQLDSEQFYSPSKQPEQVPLKPTERSPSDQTHHCSLNTEVIQVFGAFHGLKVLTARRSVASDRSDGGRDGAVCFKTSVREHSTVRTNVFPHGKTFTSHTPDGSCRFLWVPNQN